MALRLTISSTKRSKHASKFGGQRGNCKALKEQKRSNGCSKDQASILQRLSVVLWKKMDGKDRARFCEAEPELKEQPPPQSLSVPATASLIYLFELVAWLEAHYDNERIMPVAVSILGLTRFFGVSH